MQGKLKPSLGNERRFVLEVCDGRDYFISTDTFKKESIVYNTN